MAIANSSLEALVRSSRDAARELARSGAAARDGALAEMARSLTGARERILSANRADVEAARREGKPPAFLDRLLLDEGRAGGMAKAVRDVARLPDPLGEVTERWTRPNGLEVEKVRMPLGVVLMIYEARPNVTSDAAALCLKSGNAVILRGGSEAHRTNQAIGEALREGIARAGLPEASVQLVPTADREAMVELLRMEGLIDLCIPRGGEGLIRFVAEHARIPVVKHYKGVCHVYVHAAADLEKAERIILNAKTQRPGVCNAAECLLVDREVADRFLPKAGARARRAQGGAARLPHRSRTAGARRRAGEARRPRRLRPGVPGPDPRSPGGAGPRPGAGAHRPLRLRAHRGDRHRGPRRRRPRSPARWPPRR